MKINFPKHWHLSRCCGRKFSEKSDAYVSEAIEVLQLKFIDDFACKASLTGNKNHSIKHELSLIMAHHNILQNGRAIADAAFVYNSRYKQFKGVSSVSYNPFYHTFISLGA